MTLKEFQKKYHEYSVTTAREALDECAKVNREGITDPLHVAIAVKIGDRYCLMIEVAAFYCENLGYTECIGAGPSSSAGKRAIAAEVK